MLSGETASGKYPIEALKTMTQIVMAAEDNIDYWKRFRKATYDHTTTITDAISHTSCLTAMDLDAKAIVIPTQSGYTARMVSRFRPSCILVALAPDERTRRQLAISWGVVAFLTGTVDSSDRLFSMCVDCVKKEGIAEIGDTVVITAGVPIGRTGSTNLIKAQVVK
jgi:pyruvate kinase